MSNATLYYSYWRRSINLKGRRKMDIPNMSINMPLMYNNVPNLHAPVPTEINQQSNPINPEATHADNNTSDDIKTGGVSVYV